MTTATDRKFLSTPSIALCFGILAIAFAPILIKVSYQELDANVIVFHRFWIATSALGIGSHISSRQKNKTLRFWQASQSDHRRYWFLLLMAGIADALCMVAWTWSLQRTSIAHSVILHNLTPVFAAFGGWLLLGQYFDKKFLLGVAIAICGSIALIGNDGDLLGGSLIGDAAALFSAMAYSVKLLAIERLRDKLPTATIIFWVSLTTTLSVIPTALFFGGTMLPTSWFIWIAILLQGLVCEVIGQGAIAYSLKTLSSGFVSLCLLLEPAFAALLAWFIFSQGLSLAEILAFSIILLGVYFAQSQSAQQKKREDIKVANLC
jgi:drug/metabolite transporter (DMT)-like permease